MNKLRRASMCASVLAGLGLAMATPSVLAQKVAAVPQLDLKKMTGIWFEQAHLPDKWEKRCVSDNVMLFALSDKPASFQQGTFCRVAGGNLNSRNDSGKLDKSGNGILKVRHLVIFSIKLHVLAASPDFTWLLLGTPNHKTLALISRQVTPDPDTLSQMRTVAANQGFKVDKLVPVTHPGGYYHPNDKADHTSSSASTTAPADATPGSSVSPSVLPSTTGQPSKE